LCTANCLTVNRSNYKESIQFVCRSRCTV